MAQDLATMEFAGTGEGGNASSPNPKKKRGPWHVVFVIALIVFIGSLVALGIIVWGYLHGQQTYDEIAGNAQIDEDSGFAKIDWDALRKANPDTVAWLYMPDTRINYPVVQAQDNDYYLLHDFYGEEGWPVHVGAIFLDYQNKPDFSDPCIFIYGHHMNDGSMFAGIEDLADQQNFDAHRTVYVILPDRTYKLRSFSLVHCYDWERIVQTEFVDKGERTDYVQDKIDRSMVDPGDIPAANKVKRVFALATCDSFFDTNMRYVLFCTVEEVLGVSSDHLSDEIVADVGEEASDVVGESEGEDEDADEEGSEGDSPDEQASEDTGAAEGEGAEGGE